jgi:glycosyltransferase involved in cell wall biosynthesis
MFSLSIILPAYQEEKSLKNTTKSILATFSQYPVSTELFIIDDGSTDQTGTIADDLKSDHPLIQVIHQQNQGIGGAFETGLNRASGEYVMLWPADMPMTPEDIEPFIRHFGKADVIVGCRPSRPGYNTLMKLNSWLFLQIIRLACGLNLRDVNWICLYRRDLFQNTRFFEKRIPMLSEMLLVARSREASFLEVTIPMKPRAFGSPSAGKLNVMGQSLLGLIRLAWRFNRFRTQGHPMSPLPASPDSKNVK